jgi:hypothetical protein
MASVAAVVRWSGTPNQMWPISMTPNSGVIRRYEASPRGRSSGRFTNVK